jgi:hypothetical protein
MYCSSCGAALTQELSYCNRCGANLSPPEALATVSRPAGLGWIISLGTVMTTGVAVGGLTLVLALVLELFKGGFPAANTTAIGIVSLVLLLGTVALLSRQLSRLITIYLQPDNTAQPKKAKSRVKPPVQLAAPLEPLPSVTEHTTRTFEPSYRQRNT